MAALGTHGHPFVCAGESLSSLHREFEWVLYVGDVRGRNTERDGRCSARCGIAGCFQGKAEMALETVVEWPNLPADMGKGRDIEKIG